MKKLIKNLKDASKEELQQALYQRRKNNPTSIYTPNEKCQKFLEMVGEDKTFISLFSAANGVGKTCLGANILAHILWGQSGNKWFGNEGFKWEFNRGEVHQEGIRKAIDLPLYNNWPYPKRGRIVSDPTTVKETIEPELKKWFPKGRYKTNKKGKNYSYFWQTDTGHVFELMTYDQSLTEFESATLGWCYFDEPPPLAIFKATVARMRRGGIIFIGATPLTGSAWMYDNLVIASNRINKEFKMD